MVLDGLKPERVMKYFEDICSIPHGSRDMGRIAQYCMEFAEKHGLDAVRDASDNVIIRKPRSSDCASDETVIIQGHLDMVCAKESGCDMDFRNEGLRLRHDGSFIWADGTTLGGDDGIAVAMALAVLEADDITHPALECIFTTDEEIGMLGATALDMGAVKGKYLINIDSEDEGIFTVSCAGGGTITAALPAASDTDIDTSKAEYVKIKVGGLTGGHSGVEIDRGRANACKLLGSFLAELEKLTPFCIADIHGGEKDNAIPRECEAGILVTDTTPVFQLISLYEAIYQEKYSETDPYLYINYDDTRKWGGHILGNKITKLLAAAPNGVREMSADIDGLVKTSSNLGVISSDSEKVTITFSVRSSDEKKKEALIKDITSLITECGGTYELDGLYPAWEYKEESRLRDACIDAYRELYGKEPIITAIHAGLECGIFCGRKPELDCISFGPDIHDIHTPKEKLDIKSTERVYKFLLNLLKRL
ncbi:MAG: aminoacyl-histidine dipeptidase [Candidatus Ornithomonoglobus sp.]